MYIAGRAHQGTKSYTAGGARVAPINYGIIPIVIA